MSPIVRAISFITGLFTPQPASSPPEVQTSNRNITMKKPTETSDSYFPMTTAAGSRRSSVTSSISSQGSFAAKAPETPHPLDALAREYPKPAEEIDVAKQLAMAPRQRSLHDSLRRAATADRVIPVDDADTKARKLAAAKAELLALAGKV